MLTDVQVYCMTSMIYLFRPPLTAKAIYRKMESKVVYLISLEQLVLFQLIKIIFYNIIKNKLLA